MKQTLNHADGKSGYAFNTLWQEITNAVGFVRDSVVNGLAVTEKTEQLRDYYDIQGRLNWSEAILTSNKSSNKGLYLFGALCLALLIVLVVLATKKKQS